MPTSVILIGGLGATATSDLVRCMYDCHAGHYEGLRWAEQMSACG